MVAPQGLARASEDLGMTAPWPRVLVIEDDETLGRMIARLLVDVADVYVAPNGAAALDWLLSEPAPDVVVTDLMMPEVDGLAVTRILRRDPQLRSIPVLMLTARASETDLSLGIHAGAQEYVSKPFRAADLRAKVLRLVRQRQRAA